MNEKTAVITEQEGKYTIENRGISDFALIGILECILFDLKSAQRGEPLTAQTLTSQKESVPEIVESRPAEIVQAENGQAETERVETGQPDKPAESKEVPAAVAAAAAPADDSSAPAAAAATAAATVGPDIRARIKKAVEAIRGLGGQPGNIDLTNMSDEELQMEFDELTTQYKRLKNSTAGKTTR